MDDDIQGTEEKGTQPSLFWLDQIKTAEDSFDKFFERGRKVVERYRDERGALETRRKKFNILWSNVQVLKPALYGRQPKPQVERRYRDADPVGRTAAMLLERALEYEVEQNPDFSAAMNGAVEDRLLPGRGVAWQRGHLMPFDGVTRTCIWSASATVSP